MPKHVSRSSPALSSAPVGRLPWRPAVRLCLVAVALYVGFTAAGLLLSRVLTPSSPGGWEDAVIDWLAARRTPGLTALSALGSDLAVTLYVFVLTAAAALGFRLWLGRWRVSLALLLCVSGEWVLFRLVNATVGRERPDQMLEHASLTASFPSGHAGIAFAFYGGLGLILLRTLTHRRLAVAVASVCFAVPVVVALTRVYRGMHFPTDVAGSALLAGIWIAFVVATLLPRRERPGPSGE